MNILFELGHPAHVHLFRNFISYLKKNAHNITIATRNKEITNNLLDYYGLEYTSLSDPANGLLGMLKELLLRDIKILDLHKKKKFDVCFGSSVSIAHLTALTGVKSYCFSEDDDPVVPLYVALTYPFCSGIAVPSCLDYSKWKNKRIKHNSYHELAYLHPDNFTPDEHILKKYGLEKGKYAIARFSALKAHHDINAKGISKSLWEQIEPILNGYEIIKSSETERAQKIELWDMHHIMAFAKMIISDSQTMTIEAAVLGVPAVRINTFIGKSTVIDELEQKYKLSYGLLPNQENEILNTITEIINDADSSETYTERQNIFLSEKIDLNNWMIDFFEEKINKI
ncbi:MAG: DUF354 domain-containing protein [bacterium]